MQEHPSPFPASLEICGPHRLPGTPSPFCRPPQIHTEPLQEEALGESAGTRIFHHQETTPESSPPHVCDRDRHTSHLTNWPPRPIPGCFPPQLSCSRKTLYCSFSRKACSSRHVIVGVALSPCPGDQTYKYAFLKDKALRHLLPSGAPHTSSVAPHLCLCSRLQHFPEHIQIEVLTVNWGSMAVARFQGN